MTIKLPTQEHLKRRDSSSGKASAIVHIPTNLSVQSTRTQIIQTAANPIIFS